MKAPIPEHEENLIVEYIYTSYLFQILENDSQSVGTLKFKIPEVYQNLIENKLKYLRKQLIALKAQMKDLKIKVADPVRINEEFIEYRYYPHGYEGTMRFWIAAMEYEGTRRLKVLFNISL
jgi:hypothetical protein